MGCVIWSGSGKKLCSLSLILQCISNSNRQMTKYMNQANVLLTLKGTRIRSETQSTDRFNMCSCNWILCCVLQSTFLSLMTSTASEAASYEFTTLTCIPGVIEVHTFTLHCIWYHISSFKCTFNTDLCCSSVQRGQHPVAWSARNHRGRCPRYALVSWFGILFADIGEL